MSGPDELRTLEETTVLQYFVLNVRLRNQAGSLEKPANLHIELGDDTKSVADSYAPREKTRQHRKDIHEVEAKEDDRESLPR